MFVEHRTYSLKPGATAEYFAALGTRGYQLHAAAVPCLGWYYSEAGPLFQMISMWRYESFVDRLRRRADLYAQPEWQTLMARVQPLVTNIESRYVVPMPYWHGKGPTLKPLRAVGNAAALTSKDIPDRVPFIEHRIYTLKPGSLHRYLAGYGADGFQIHETHAPCVGFYYTEAGALFQLISMWQFDSFEERLARRAELNARPDWQQKMAGISGLVDRIESKFLLCAPFVGSGD